VVGTDILRGGDTVAAGVNRPLRPVVQSLRPAAKCQGAMSQQGSGAHGNESYPQKLVQLVGYRDPEMQLEAWGRLKLKRSGCDGLK
jgi:hypothetical protein